MIYERQSEKQATVRYLCQEVEDRELMLENLRTFIMEKIVGDEPATGQGQEPLERPVRVNFQAAPSFQAQESPFRKAERVEKRLKMFLWGASGSGKTTLALRFPKPAVIDLERGTEHYGDDFQFDVLPASTSDQVETAIDWLLTNQHEYRTLVIDPVTLYWESLTKKWSDIFLRRNKGSKGYKFEFYELQPRDWNTIKGELKETIRKLLALDMNVIVTAREKVLYEEGSFMRAAGTIFDGEKSLPYMFDTVLRLYKDGEKFMAENLKDRTNKMPKGAFEVSYDLFEKGYGSRTISRKATPVKLASQPQKEKIANLAREFGISDEKLAERLQSYGAESLEDLTRQNADVIIGKMEAALAAKKPAITQPTVAEEAGKESTHAA